MNSRRSSPLPPINRRQKLSLLAVIAILLFSMTVGADAQQEPPGAGASKSAGDQSTQVAERIEVKPVASDQAINRRLSDILKETGWFSEIAVDVGQGVVFLDGRTDSSDYRDWAGELAGKTRDVVAVVNRIQVRERSPWDFSPAVEELQNLWKRTQQRLPRLGFGLLLLLLAALAARLMTNGTRKILEHRLKPLLCDVAARIFGILVFLIGLYLVLQVAGLSRLAGTILGGTGLVGLVAGIAFRDILENYLSSILISVRNPFHIGDLVEIAGHTGVVQRVTTRGTVLMNLDGNHVQIPNATVYKSIIRNFTANPFRREMFEVGIGFENEIAFAQEAALKVLNGHPAVLRDPEALVLVDRLGSATVNLKVYFWYDGVVYNGQKVKSSLIRLVLRAFEKERISMPDEAREVLFPEGLSIRMQTPEVSEEPTPPSRTAELSPAEPDTITTEAEGHLTSEEDQLRAQARKARIPEESASLIEENHAGRDTSVDRTDSRAIPPEPR